MQICLPVSAPCALLAFLGMSVHGELLNEWNEEQNQEEEEEWLSGS